MFNLRIVLKVLQSAVRSQIRQNLGEVTLKLVTSKGWRLWLQSVFIMYSFETPPVLIVD